MDNFLIEYKKRTDTKDKTKDLFAMSFQLLQIAEDGGKKSYEKLVEKNSERTNLAKKLINLYYAGEEANYESMLYNFRKKYIENEAKVEYNDEDQKLEYIGLGYMYDYIQQFDTSNTEFNLFIETMKLHKLLYKAFDDNNKEEREATYIKYQEELAQAKKNKDLAEYKRVSELIKGFSQSSSSFGGSLRTNEVDLKGVDFHVPTAREASEFLNSFLNLEKRIEYQNLLSSTNTFGYIEYCVKIAVDIIKYQPFENGNKRTARALLNLMFKNKNIPPVYITKKERKPYKDALLKAVVDNDYTDIINFYYFKICDSIYELDILPYINKRNSKEIIEEKPDNLTDDSDMKFYHVGKK